MRVSREKEGFRVEDVRSFFEGEVRGKFVI